MGGSAIGGETGEGAAASGAKGGDAANPNDSRKARSRALASRNAEDGGGVGAVTLSDIELR